MTWLANLLQIYEENTNAIGHFEKKRNGQEYALIPISHTTQSAHIEVHLDMDGNYLLARVVEKEESSTIIPCTEASASRTSAPVPYPLFDKLMYVAGDYDRYCPEADDKREKKEQKSKKAKDGAPPVKEPTPYQLYLQQLYEWCSSSHSHPKVHSVLAYIRNGTLITDLVTDGILHVNQQGVLIDKWKPADGQKADEKPQIFKVLAGDQQSAFVRFAVEKPGEPEARLWRDPSVQESFIGYCKQILPGEDLCYVKGEYMPYADKHTSRIRNSGDKAKLISANDSAGFTYRGRFKTSRDAAVVSYEVSQKGHNALKWLVEKQGTFPIDGKVFVVWGTKQLVLPDPFMDSFDLYEDKEEDTGEVGNGTQQAFARQIRKAINGFRYDGEHHARVVVMALDAATPGRMSIVYYRDLEHNPFLDQLQHWHETCSWVHRYRKKEDNKFTTFYGAPATRDIAFAAYGSRVSDKVVKGVLERMLPCIIDNQPLPKDIVRSVVNRASNPVGMENWEWEKTLSIACALVSKMNEKEGFQVNLDKESRDRSYLFGRLLAIADVLERSAFSKEERRASNATRYMNAFSRHPARTWDIIQKAIQPYQAKLGSKARYHTQLLDEVLDMIKPEDFIDRPLSPSYLQGLSSQRIDLYTSKKAKESTSGESEIDEISFEQEEK